MADCDVDPFSCVFSLAATAGLLLPSTEVPLLVDVLESLKGYVEKSFRNKDEFLLFNDGKAMTQLMELVKHNDKAVQLASLELLQTLLPPGWEVGVEKMRRVPSAVDDFIQILAPHDFDPSVHEIGFFCLMRYLRNDSKSVLKFCEHGGVPVLLSLLTLNNFDILSLNLQCLYWVLLESLSSRLEVMDARTFVDQIGEFCCSPIEEVQSVSCDIVLLLSQLRKLRNKLRCIGTLEKLCGLILEGDVISNLLVQLLEILANCLTDEPANVQFAQGAGLFGWCFDVVTEKEPVVRWDKTYALSLRLLSLFASSRENRLTLRDLEVETSAMKLAKTKSGHVTAAALRLMWKLCGEEESREVYGRLGAVSLVLDYLLERKPAAASGKTMSGKSGSAATKSSAAKGRKGGVLKSVGTAAEIIAPHETDFEIASACLSTLTTASRQNVDFVFTVDNANRLIEFLKTSFLEVATQSEPTAINGFDALRNLFIDADNAVHMAEKASLIETTCKYLDHCRDGRNILEALACPSWRSIEAAFAVESKLGAVSTSPVVGAIDFLTAFHEAKNVVEQTDNREVASRVRFLPYDYDDDGDHQLESGEMLPRQQQTPEMQERRRRLHSVIEEALLSENVHVVVAVAKLAAALAKSRVEGATLIRGGLLALLWRRWEALTLEQALSRSQKQLLQTCLRRILSCDLSLKYSLLGRLDSSDLISEKFYDIGAKKGVEEALVILDKDLFQKKGHWREILAIDKSRQRKEILEFISNDKLPRPNETPPPVPGSSVSHESAISVAAEMVNVTVTTERGSVHPGVSDGSLQHSNTSVESGLVKDPAVKAPVNDGPIQILRYVEEIADAKLRTLIRRVKNIIGALPTLESQIRCLGILVCFQYGGLASEGDSLPPAVEKELRRLRKEKNSGLVFVGEMEKGAAYHRSLLFKVLADELAIPCTLVRGDYFRGWNEVWLSSVRGWFYPTDTLRWLLHHYVNSEESTKATIPILSTFDELPKVSTKDAPPDSLTVSLAMAMAIQTQFLKILLVDDKTANEFLGFQKGESREIDVADGAMVEKICDCADHSEGKCHCCQHCPGWLPSDLPRPSCMQTEDAIDAVDAVWRPKKFLVDLCFHPGTIISERDEESDRNYTHF